MCPPIENQVIVANLLDGWHQRHPFKTLVLAVARD
jgi:hypothetical protein